MRPYTPRYPNAPQVDVIEASDEIVSGGRFVANAPAAQVVIPASASNATSLDCSKGTVFTFTPGENTTITPKNLAPGQRLSIHFTAATNVTVTFGSPFLSTGTLAMGATPGKVFVVVFECDPTGAALREVSRTAAM